MVTTCRSDERAPYDPMPHGPAEVGVGPWEGPLADRRRSTTRELLAEGDRRNVVDRYRYWTMAAIVADLDARRHDFHVAIENWQHDFNIGTIVRSANAFLAARCTSSATGAGTAAARWSPTATSTSSTTRTCLRSRRTCATSRAGRSPCGASTTCPARCTWRPPRCRAGSASSSARRDPGCPTPAREACDATFSIAQFGSTRSINASAAAAIAMHAWVRAHADLSGQDAWRG